MIEVVALCQATAKIVAMLSLAYVEREYLGRIGLTQRSCFILIGLMMMKGFVGFDQQQSGSHPSDTGRLIGEIVVRNRSSDLAFAELGEEQKAGLCTY